MYECIAPIHSEYVMIINLQTLMSPNLPSKCRSLPVTKAKVSKKRHLSPSTSNKISRNQRRTLFAPFEAREGIALSTEFGLARSGAEDEPRQAAPVEQGVAVKDRQRMIFKFNNMQWCVHYQLRTIVRFGERVKESQLSRCLCLPHHHRNGCQCNVNVYKPYTFTCNAKMISFFNK